VRRGLREDVLEKAALLGLAGDYGGTLVAASEDRLQRAQVQPTLLTNPRMALQARPIQERLDLAVPVLLRPLCALLPRRGSNWEATKGQ
jgi:hypothetical protein